VQLVTISCCFFAGGLSVANDKPVLTPINMLLLSGNHPHESEGIKAQVGDSIETIQKIIGSTGGEIEITQGSAAGVIVTVPPGAFNEDISVTLSQNSGSLSPNEGVFSDIVIDITPGELTHFANPIQITVPFNSSNGFPVPYYINEKGYLKPCQIVNIDTNAGIMTFETYHASFFTWIYSLTTIPREDLTKFKTGDDGFRITNYGTAPLTTGGECFGMSTFAIWYFDKKGSGLYDKYWSNISACTGGDVKGQDIIATRAHLSVSRQWSLYVPKLQQLQGFSDLMRMGWIRNVLSNTKIPTVLYLYNNSSHNGTHAVVAYDMNELNTTYIYDPNYPNSTKSVVFNNSTHQFESYNGYGSVAPLGTGTFFYKESFENIWKDAENGFSSPDATVEITSHTSGETVQDRNQTITGDVTFGQAIVEKIEIYVNGVTYSSTVSSSGSFSLSVTLDSGENKPKFTTKAYDQANNLVTVSNNLQCEQFTLNAPSDDAVILVTLTWDKNDTDLDLYTIDPTGDYSAYYHKITGDGGELDYDDTNGYGPEHWTLQYSDTVRWDQDYRIRVHYYSDHGNGGTNYDVTVKLYEGTDKESLQSFSGYLSSNNSSNDGPNDTGADWANIVTIRPVQTATGASFARAKMSISKDGSVPIITVPVPSPAERLEAKQHIHAE
ncbi:hypothetical protein JYT30_01205, partial [Desulfotalea psychrophila]|nr:hypothetical protein [Desulfotalea psychrophila]